MRKKTIEEELKEIQAEKETHIDRLQKEHKTSKDKHTYDFKNEIDNYKKDALKRVNKITESFQNQIDQLDEMEENVDALLKKKITKAEFDAWLEAFEKRNSEINAPSQEKINKVDDKSSDALVQSSQSVDTSFDQSHQQKSTSNKSRIKNPVVTIIASLIFLMAGLAMSIFGGIVPWIKSASYVSVEAEVIAVDFYHDSDGDYMGRVTYAYVYNNTPYIHTSSVSQSASVCPSVGEKVKIKVNPNNPEDVLDGTFIHIILTFFGLPFAGVGTFLLIYSIKEKRNNLS